MVPLLWITFAVVAGLLIQGALALRAHRDMVEATIGDFAGFAADRIAMELDQMFSAVFLDQISASRAAHYAWLADPSAERSRPSGATRITERMVPHYFSFPLDASGLVAHGTVPLPDQEEWIVEALLPHLPVYPRPAPYAVLRSDRSTAVVYRKEVGYDGEQVYGFVVDLAEFGHWYAAAADEAGLLPRSLGPDVASVDLLAIGLHLTPSGPAIFSRPATRPVEGPTAWAFAAKAGRLAVGVTIDQARAAAMVVAGPAGASPVALTALGALTLALLGLATRLTQQSARLASMRERFVANVSHDLRTPITQIRMFAETLLMGRLVDADERARALRVIHRQTEILEDLVDNVLHASDERPGLRPEPADVAALVADVVEGLGPLAESKGSTVACTVRHTEPVVVDPIAVTRILTNLVDNALRHGPPGQEVRVSAERDADRLVLVVDDEGRSIPPTDRERLFLRFERMDAPAGVERTGAGLGLAVVRDLAERHGGGARIEEAPSGGVRVRVWLATGTSVDGTSVDGS